MASIEKKNGLMWGDVVRLCEGYSFGLYKVKDNKADPLVWV